MLWLDGEYYPLERDPSEPGMCALIHCPRWLLSLPLLTMALQVSPVASARSMAAATPPTSARCSPTPRSPTATSSLAPSARPTTSKCQLHPDTVRALSVSSAFFVDSFFSVLVARPRGSHSTVGSSIYHWAEILQLSVASIPKNICRYLHTQKYKTFVSKHPCRRFCFRFPIRQSDVYVRSNVTRRVREG